MIHGGILLAAAPAADLLSARRICVRRKLQAMGFGLLLVLV